MIFLTSEFLRTLGRKKMKMFIFHVVTNGSFKLAMVTCPRSCRQSAHFLT